MGEVIDASLSELGSLCRLALRGAGYDWGHAEDGAAWMVWLAQNDLPGPAVLAHFLVAEREAAARQCPIAAGAALSDMGALPEDGLHIDGLLAPLLLVPSLALHHMSYVVSWEGFTCEVLRGQGVRTRGDGAKLDLAPRVTIMPMKDPAQSGVPRLHHRAQVEAESWTVLKTQAAQTFAPASEASRAGAGAGNDGNED